MALALELNCPRHSECNFSSRSGSLASYWHGGGSSVCGVCRRFGVHLRTDARARTTVTCACRESVPARRANGVLRAWHSAASSPKMNLPFVALCDRTVPVRDVLAPDLQSRHTVRYCRMTSPRVLVVLDVFAAWSRGVLKGIAEVADERGWTLLHYHPGTDLRWLVKAWKPSVTVITGHDDVLDSLVDQTVVSVNHDATHRAVASVCLNEERIADLACQHLVDRGLRNLTTFRFDNSPFAVTRTDRFLESARSRGVNVASSWWNDNAVPPRSQEHPEIVAQWLRELPKPCGIFAASDNWARVVARYAKASDWSVPEELALIGVDNDTVQCELTSPSLSSVAIPWRTMGHLAAELVRDALARKATCGARVVLDPVDVIARRSTDVRAVTDPVVARAVEWISEHAGRRLTLLVVARELGVSRQRLERLFHSSIGRTVMQEVRRARLARAKLLLSTTSDELSRIAKLCGFATAAMLSVAVRDDTGMTPSDYRRRFKGLYLDQT